MWRNLNIWACQLNVKGYVRPRTGRKGPEDGCSYRSILPFTSALGRGGWTKPHPGRLIPMKETGYPLVQEVGWASRPVYTDAKNLAPTTT